MDDSASDDGVEEAWDIEIQRWAEEIRSGKVQTILTKRFADAWLRGWPVPGSKPYRFHPQAWRELEAADDWYRQRRLDASVRFLSAVYAALEDVARWLRSWPVFKRGTRRFIFHRFPFSIIYLEETAAISIVAVAHGTRKPGYWRDRLSSGTENQI